MSDCGCEFTPETATERRSLRIALGLNAIMFVVGLVAGVLAESTGLIADSLDMLADADCLCAQEPQTWSDANI